MQRNLAALKRKEQRLLGGSTGSRNTARTKRKILRRMRRKGCGRTETRTAKLKRGTITDQIFGVSRKKRSGKRAKLRSTEDSLRNFGTYRTMCVRTCDGYKFPVSFSTKRGSFGKDGNACNKLCPGTEMELFYRRTSGESADNLISTASGQPYSALPNAFAFQKAFNPQCSCNFNLVKPEKKAGIAITDLPRGSRKITLSRKPVPAFRNRADEVAALKKQNESKPVELFAERKVAGNRKVREVGDAFYPTQ